MYYYARHIFICTQCNSDDDEYPLLSPNEFILPYNNTTFNVDNVKDAQWQYQTRMAMRSHKYKHHKHIDGALYSDIFLENAEIIDIEPGNSLDIAIRLPDGSTTTVTVFVDMDGENKHLQNCRCMAQKLSLSQPNTFRQTTHDRGNVYIVGNSPKGDGTTGVHELTNLDGVHELLEKVTLSAEHYYRQNHLSHHIDAMRSHGKHANVSSM